MLRVIALRLLLVLDRFCTAHTPSTRSIGAVSTARTPRVLAVFRPPVEQYSQYSGVRDVLDAPSTLGV